MRAKRCCRFARLIGYDGGMRRKLASWRLILLLPAFLLFSLGGYEIIQHIAVLKRGEDAIRPLPPTMYGAHSGMAAACIALGLVFVLGAMRKQI